MTASARRAIPLLPRMTGRDPHETGRAASPLELFFDLVFVVAVSLASQQLHHLDAEGHPGAGLLSYLMVFFAIWWAWMNFTWFATSFDTDDWLYRVMTIVQMGGVLVLAAGTSDAMNRNDFTLVTIGYVIMRLALVAQWIRAGLGSARLRRTAFRYASGIVLVQALWLARLALPQPAGLICFFVLAALEVAIPIWAERAGQTPWNPHHIAERFGLFTLILLGESILASANAIIGALEEGHHVPDLIAISGTGLIIAAGMWWVYVARPQHQHISGFGSTLRFGYFHYVIFAAAGAFSAGIEVTIDIAADHTSLPRLEAAATLTVPIALFLVSIWWLTVRHTLRPLGNAVYLAAVVVVFGGTLLTGVPSAAIAALGVVIAVIGVEAFGVEDSGPEVAASAPPSRDHTD